MSIPLMIIFLSLVLWLCVVATSTHPAGVGDSKVVIVSMDGFRWDYYGNTSSPNLDYFNEKGVQVGSKLAGFASYSYASRESDFHGG